MSSSFFLLDRPTMGRRYEPRLTASFTVAALVV
jgi:hypothetical protein